MLLSRVLMERRGRRLRVLGMHIGSVIVNKADDLVITVHWLSVRSLMHVCGGLSRCIEYT